MAHTMFRTVVKYLFIAWMLCLHSGLASFAAGAFPTPVETPNESFPCATHNCGCRNANDCLTDCCCFPKTKLNKPVLECCPNEITSPAPINLFLQRACRGSTEDTPCIPVHFSAILSRDIINFSLTEEACFFKDKRLYPSFNSDIHNPPD